MRTAIVIAAAAFGLGLALANQASADVVDPRNPVQPISAGLVSDQGPAPSTRPSPPAEQPAGEPPVEQPVPADGAVAPSEPAVVEAPPPEVRPAVARPRPTPAAQVFVRPSAEAVKARGWTIVMDEAASVTRRVVDGAQSLLAHALAVCRVGVDAGTGGPVLVLAVLGLASVALNRRAWLSRLVVDDDAPEFLYAAEVIAPG